MNTPHYEIKLDDNCKTYLTLNLFNKQLKLPYEIPTLIYRKQVPDGREIFSNEYKSLRHEIYDSLSSYYRRSGKTGTGSRKMIRKIVEQLRYSSEMNTLEVEITLMISSDVNTSIISDTLTTMLFTVLPAYIDELKYKRDVYQVLHIDIIGGNTLDVTVNKNTLNNSPYNSPFQTISAVDVYRSVLSRLTACVTKFNCGVYPTSPPFFEVQDGRLRMNVVTLTEEIVHIFSHHRHLFDVVWVVSNDVIGQGSIDLPDCLRRIKFNSLNNVVDKRYILTQLADFRKYLETLSRVNDDAVTVPVVSIKHLTTLLNLVAVREE